MHRSLNAALRQWVSDTHDDWAEHIPLVQFALNNRFNATTGFAPFELTRAYPPRSLPSWMTINTGKGAEEALQELFFRIEKARDATRVARVRQAVQANKHRRAEQLPINENGSREWKAKGKAAPGERYLLSTENLRPVANRTRKLNPPFIGPFQLLSYDPQTSTYELDLPERYTRRGLSKRVHASLVRRFVESDSARFPQRVTNTVPIFPLDSMATSIQQPEGIQLPATADLSLRRSWSKFDGEAMKAYRDEQEKIYYVRDDEGALYVNTPSIGTRELPPLDDEPIIVENKTETGKAAGDGLAAMETDDGEDTTSTVNAPAKEQNTRQVPPPPAPAPTVAAFHPASQPTFFGEPINGNLPTWMPATQSGRDELQRKWSFRRTTGHNLTGNLLIIFGVIPTPKYVKPNSHIKCYLNSGDGMVEMINFLVGQGKLPALRDYFAERSVQRVEELSGNVQKPSLKQRQQQRDDSQHQQREHRRSREDDEELRSLRKRARAADEFNQLSGALALEDMRAKLRRRANRDYSDDE
ncbi:hypothetical protein JCM10213_008534 [Rhodosporidiobolus nylandii]